MQLLNLNQIAYNLNWITEADPGYVRLYGYMPKSVIAGLGCVLGCTPAL